MTTYYVATDGDDGEDGLSEGTAWATVDHASSTIANGDMVILAAGVYQVPSSVDPPANSTWVGVSPSNPDLVKFQFGSGVKFEQDGTTFQAISFGNAYPVSMYVNGSNVTIDHCQLACWLWGIASGLSFDTVSAKSFGMMYITIANGVLTDCDFSGSTNSITFFGDGISISNCIGAKTTSMRGFSSTIAGFSGHLQIYGSSTNSVTNLDCGGKEIDCKKVAGGDGVQTITGVASVGKVSVDAGAELIMYFADKSYYQHSMAIWTSVDVAGDTSMDVDIAVSDIVFTKREIEMTTDTAIDVIIDTWSVAGEMEKEWRVSGTGNIVLGFSIGDMSARTNYELCAEDETSGVTRSDEGGVVNATHSGSFSIKEFRLNRYYRSKRLMR